MGHGTRESYGYSREMKNESYVVGELSKLWNASTSATSRDLEERDARIRKLEEEIAEQARVLKEAVEHFKPAIRKELDDMRRAELIELEKRLRTKGKKR